MKFITRTHRDGNAFDPSLAIEGRVIGGNELQLMLIDREDEGGDD